MAKHSEFGAPRLLVIDDNVAKFTEDFRKVLCGALEKEADDAYLAAEAALFGEVAAASGRSTFMIDSEHTRGRKVSKWQAGMAQGAAYNLVICRYANAAGAGMALRPLSTCGPSIRTYRW